jgi:hypothetical protein
MDLSMIEAVLDREQCKTTRFIGGINQWGFENAWDRDKHLEWLEKTFHSDSSCPIEYVTMEIEEAATGEFFAPATARTA